MDELEDDQLEDDEIDVRPVLHEHLERMITMVAENRPLAHAVWVMVGRGNQPAHEVSNSLVSITERLLSEASRGGQLLRPVDQLDCRLAAETLTMHTMIAAGQPGFPPRLFALFDLLVGWVEDET